MQNKINYFALSRKGEKNQHNEDSFFVPQYIQQDILKSNGYLFIVCDGVGGHQAGEIASKFCTEWMQHTFYGFKIKDDFLEFLIDTIKNINRRMYHFSGRNPSYRGMATTLVNLLIRENKAYMNNVGDSRIYFYNGKQLRQISEDHSLVWEDYKKGIFPKKMINEMPYKNIITQAIGLSSVVKINSYELELPEKFLFLLCSDGLTDVIEDRELEKIIENAIGLESCAQKLYDLSQNNKSSDDVTIILVSNYLE